MRRSTATRHSWLNLLSVDVSRAGLRRVDGYAHGAPPSVGAGEMPSKPRMPDDEDRRFAVLVSGHAPAEGFGNEAPGHRSTPADEVRGVAVDPVVRLIDHEAEATDVILAGGDEDAAPLSPGPALPAERRNDLDKAALVLGRDGGHNNPVPCMRVVEGAAILFAGLAWLEGRAKDRLPGVGPAVFDRSLGTTAFERREEVRKGDRHERPFG